LLLPQFSSADTQREFSQGDWTYTPDVNGERFICQWGILKKTNQQEEAGRQEAELKEHRRKLKNDMAAHKAELIAARNDGEAVQGTSAATAGEADEVAKMLDNCGLLGVLGILHEELGVEAYWDLIYVHRADLKEAVSLKPVQRNKLIRCVCALDLSFEDPELCPGRGE